MRLLFLTPGTGSYYCGVCMRDNALVKELCRQGHDAVLLPLYLPLTLEESAATPDAPVFFGGVNVYLQQKFPWFRQAPAWVDRWLDHPWLLKWVGRFSGMTQGGDIGALTLSMLRGEEGAQGREVEKLVRWMAEGERPDVVWLSTALMVGVARRIREVVQVPVLCSLQGEDSFLDGLSEPWRERSWKEAGARCGELSRLVAPSEYFAKVMESRLGLPEKTVRWIPNGISLDGYEERGRRSLEEGLRIGYLARLNAAKGLDTVVDAFIDLRSRVKEWPVRLCCVGTMTEGDQGYLEAQRAKLRRAGLEAEVEFHANVSREEKVALLRGFTLLSVPAVYGEAFGLYLLEAMACGVPVVQPRHGAFGEIVEASGGGILVEGTSAGELSLAWEELLKDPDRARRLGEAGARAVREKFSIGAMASGFLKLAEEAVQSEGLGVRERGP